MFILPKKKKKNTDSLELPMEMLTDCLSGLTFPGSGNPGAQRADLH